MRIALAQINPIVGDLVGNGRKIVAYARRAREQDADLVVYPELCLTGYPPLDLLDNPAFIEATASVIDWIARNAPPDVGVLFGAPVRNAEPGGKALRNAAILLEGGREVGRAIKMLLPSYDVFDENRYFEPAGHMTVIPFRGRRLGVSVCEDMWKMEGYAEFGLYDRDPLAELADDDPDLFINLSASPYSLGRREQRTELVRNICGRFSIPFVLVNQVGANTEILFDGTSCVFSAQADPLVVAPSFAEALLVWDTEDSTPQDAPVQSSIACLHDALVTGVRDYVQKTGIFRKALVGLSGGIDSAVTCAVAAEALGAERVVGITLPSAISSLDSVTDSRRLAENLGIEFHDVSIRPAVDAFKGMLEHLFAGTLPGTAEENVQARSRGVALMAVSNKFDYLLLTTGNKSELSMGYATLYGDMSGGLAVLSDVFKTDVYRLAAHINELAGYDLIPESTMSKAPSAELAPGQRDQDTLPPYEILDEILRRYIEALEDVDVIANETGFDVELIRQVLRSVDRNEFKRRQAPPGLRVSGKAFGIGRRIPIVMKYDRREIDKLLGEASPSSLH